MIFDPNSASLFCWSAASSKAHPLAMDCAIERASPCPSSSVTEARKIASGVRSFWMSCAALRVPKPGCHLQSKPVEFLFAGKGVVRNGHSLRKWPNVQLVLRKRAAMDHEQLLLAGGLDLNKVGGPSQGLSAASAAAAAAWRSRPDVLPTATSVRTVRPCSSRLPATKRRMGNGRATFCAHVDFTRALCSMQAAASAASARHSRSRPAICRPTLPTGARPACSFGSKDIRRRCASRTSDRAKDSDTGESNPRPHARDQDASGSFHLL